MAARGIDIAELPFVVNFALPRSAADYVHRIGRTGRAGKAGLAVSLVCPDEMSQLKQVEKLIGMKIPVAELTGIAASTHHDHDLTVRPPRPPRPQAKKPAGQSAGAANGAKAQGNNHVGRQRRIAVRVVPSHKLPMVSSQTVKHDRHHAAHKSSAAVTIANRPFADA